MVKASLFLIISLGICFYMHGQNSITNSQVEETLIDLRYSLLKVDSIRFEKDWQFVCKNDSLFVIYLLKQQSQTTFIEWGIVPRLVKKGQMPAFFNDLNAANFSAIYLISAIFYRDYYFCTLPVIYNNDKILYSKTEKKHIKSENSFLRYQTTEDEIFLAWKSIIKWIKMDAIKRRKTRPLSLENLFFYGETGGLINGK